MSLESIIGTTLLALVFNYYVLFLINDNKSLTDDNNLVNRCLATRSNRIALLIPGIAVIVGHVLVVIAILRFFKYLITDFVNGKK